jgi:Tfp pilus assembly PilM family ATPase
VLLTYGYAEEEVNIPRGDFQKKCPEIVSLLKDICQKAKTSSHKAIAALPSFAVFSSLINLPNMSRKELASAIQWEAKKFIPMPIEEVVLDWKVISSEARNHPELREGSYEARSHPERSEGSSRGLEGTEGSRGNNPLAPSDNPLDPPLIRENDKEEEKGLKILLTAAPKNLVERYIEIFKEANLEFLSLETESFALVRSLVGHDSSVVTILDLGDIATDIIIVEQGIPLLSRSIEVGGKNITKTIANSLNIDFKRAEQFKRDIGLTQGRENPVPKAITMVLSSIVNEIRYSIDLYQSQNPAKSVEKIVLSGGAAFLPNLPQYLSETLGLRVYVGNPWDRVSYPLELKSVLEELGPKFAVAIGLAMREIE